MVNNLTLHHVAEVIRAAGFDRMADEFIERPGVRESVIKTVAMLMGRNDRLRAFIPRFVELTDKVMLEQRHHARRNMRAYAGRER